MKKYMAFLLSFFLIMIIAHTGQAQSQNRAGRFGFSMEYWMTSFDGEAKSSGGTNVKLVDDINVKDSDDVLKFNFLMPVTGGSVLDLSFYSLSYSGSQELTKSITFNNTLFPVGTLTKGKADADILDLKYKIFPFASNQTQLGFILGLKYVQTEAALSSADQGTQKGSADIPLPQIGVALKADLAYFRVLAELSGLALSYKDTSGSMLEFDVRGEYDIRPNIGAFLGYRYFTLDVEEKDDRAEFQISGLYAGGIYRF